FQQFGYTSVDIKMIENFARDKHGLSCGKELL
ncbi:MAG: hypothetical protein ACD_79C01242G0007, partial [uncultured bacterium]